MKKRILDGNSATGRAYPIQPRHLDTKRYQCDTFGDPDTSHSARVLVQLAQENSGWVPVSQQRLNEFGGDCFRFHRLRQYNDESGSFIQIGADHLFYYTHEFVVDYFRSSAVGTLVPPRYALAEYLLAGPDEKHQAYVLDVTDGKDALSVEVTMLLQHEKDCGTEVTFPMQRADAIFVAANLAPQTVSEQARRAAEAILADLTFATEGSIVHFVVAEQRISSWQDPEVALGRRTAPAGLPAEAHPMG